MNTFDENFEFRLANVSEVKKIMEFIRNYWPKKNHILGTNEKFFRYEFCNEDRIGYYLAINKKTGEIVAGEGQYFYSEVHIPGKTDFSSGMFLSNPNCKVPLIGIELMKRKFEDLKPRAFVGPGVNMNTSGQLYLRKLKQKVKRMKHFYILSDKDDYKIASIKEKKILKFTSQNQLNMNEIDSIESLYKQFDNSLFKGRKPYKDRWYINKRYFEHPSYKYKVFCVGNSTAIVFRDITVNDQKISRIVDILGDVGQIAFIGRDLRRFIEKNNYEYIDFYELGIDESLIAKAGFAERTENDVNIIPNYFEPYECRNVEIFVQCIDDDTLCFKADGDQDRPNHINN